MHLNHLTFLLHLKLSPSLFEVLVLHPSLANVSSKVPGAHRKRDVLRSAESSVRSWIRRRVRRPTRISWPHLAPAQKLLPRPDVREVRRQGDPALKIAGCSWAGEFQEGATAGRRNRLIISHFKGISCGAGGARLTVCLCRLVSQGRKWKSCHTNPALQSPKQGLSAMYMF